MRADEVHKYKVQLFILLSCRNKQKANDRQLIWRSFTEEGPLMHNLNTHNTVFCCFVLKKSLPTIVTAAADLYVIAVDWSVHFQPCDHRVT